MLEQKLGWVKNPKSEASEQLTWRAPVEDLCFLQLNLYVAPVTATSLKNISFIAALHKNKGLKMFSKWILKREWASVSAVRVGTRAFRHAFNPL